MSPTKPSRSSLLESLYRGYDIVQTDRPPHQHTRQKNDKFKSEECVNLRNSGRCLYEKNCHFRHPEDFLSERSTHWEQSPDGHSDLENSLVASRGAVRNSVLSNSKNDAKHGRVKPMKTEDRSTKREAKDDWQAKSENNPWTSAQSSRFRIESDHYSRNTPSRHRYDEGFLKDHKGFDDLWN